MHQILYLATSYATDSIRSQFPDCSRDSRQIIIYTKKLNEMIFEMKFPKQYYCKTYYFIYYISLEYI